MSVEPTSRERLSHIVSEVIVEMHQSLIGQSVLIEHLLIALFWQGHILIEWVPGLAKTLAVSTLAHIVDLDCKRIQFTPDLLPSDLIGARVFNQATMDFSVKKGPIFSNFVLADEINRAPSKVQSALLEAMAERQVSIWDQTYFLDRPFIVLATQNPIEQDGTYTLPEAQLDRFLLKTIVTYPTPEEEIIIMKQKTGKSSLILKKLLHKKDILEIQSLIEESIHVEASIYEYVRDIVSATRWNNAYSKKNIQYGVSPRGSIALIIAGKVYAFLDGRDFVVPEDIKKAAYPVLRHRIILSYEALADSITVDQVINNILDTIVIW
jgi:MoxR-like ATPase